MKFAKLYRLSLYLMLFLASLALCFDTAGDNPLTPLYPVAVAGAGLLAFATVDRRPELGLSRELANNLGIGSIALSLLEWWYDERLLILAIGHWLVYLELIELFRPKTVEIDWYLFLLAMVQAVVGGFVGQGDWLGIVLVAWALLALWTLGLFYLRREALRDQHGPEVTVTPRPDRHEPYPGLIDPPFLVAAFNVALITLVLGGLIFLVMPRWNSSARGAGAGGSVIRHLTGFSDEVRLGQIGEILENEAIVMSVEMYDELGNRIGPPPGTEPLWRGVAMQTYEDGRWFRQPTFALDLKKRAFPRVSPARWIRQQIKLEQTDSDVLFGLRPIVRASGHELVMNQTDGMIYRSDLRPDVSYVERFNTRPGPYDYEVISSNDGNLLQPGELYPSDKKIANKLLNVPEPLKSRLPAIVEPILAELPREQRGQEQKARKLESFLRDSGTYSYSLRMGVSDPSLDPVEDFLRNRKQGHCEYFASSLTLMLRAAGIPARMVNGFKGGDWNGLGRVVTVRQKHAHSWVEALIDEGPGGQPIWITLDPTPANERDASVAQVGGFSNRILPLKDYIRYLWVFYVAGFNAERQDRLIYKPIRQLILDSAKGFGMIWAAVRSAVGWLFHFPHGYSVFSMKGFVVSFCGMLVLAGAIRVILWIDRRVGRLLRRSRAGDAERGSSVATYRRLVQLLSAHGLERPPTETPREFARRAGDFLAARGADLAPAADTPRLVVEAFYRIRFGHLRPNLDTQRSLEARLDALETGLRPRSV